MRDKAAGLGQRNWRDLDIENPQPPSDCPRQRLMDQEIWLREQKFSLADQNFGLVKQDSPIDRWARDSKCPNSKAAVADRRDSRFQSPQDAQALERHENDPATFAGVSPVRKGRLLALEWLCRLAFGCKPRNHGAL